jgi:hypothetical protein
LGHFRIFEKSLPLVASHYFDVTKIQIHQKERKSSAEGPTVIVIVIVVVSSFSASSACVADFLSTVYRRMNQAYPMLPYLAICVSMNCLSKTVPRVVRILTLSRQATVTQSSSLRHVLNSTTVTTPESFYPGMTSRSFPKFGRNGSFRTTTSAVVRSMTTFQSTSPTFLKDDTTDYKKVSSSPSSSSSSKKTTTTTPAGSKAFVDCDREAIIDLFQEYAKEGPFLSRQSLAAILKAIGECSDEEIVNKLFEAADENGDGVIELEVCLAYFL